MGKVYNEIKKYFIPSSMLRDVPACDVALEDYDDAFFVQFHHCFL
jgi:hypothetical protein